MRTTKPFISLLFAAAILTGGYSIVAAVADPQPLPGAGSDGLITLARWEKTRINGADGWALEVALEVPKPPQTPKERFDKLVGANCNLFLSFAKTPERIEMRLTRPIDKDGKMHARFALNPAIKLAMGEWQVQITIVREGEILAKTRVKAMLGDEAGIRTANEEEKAWLQGMVKQLKALYDGIDKGDEANGLAGVDDLYKEREKTDPELDSKPDGEWYGRIYAWRDAWPRRLTAIRLELDKRNRGGVSWGITYPYTTSHLQAVAPQIGLLVDEYARDISWEDVRTSAAEAAAAESAPDAGAAGGVAAGGGAAAPAAGGGAAGGGAGGAAGAAGPAAPAAGGGVRGGARPAEGAAAGRGAAGPTRPAAERVKRKEVHTAKEALKARKELIDAGDQRFNYDDRIRRIRENIERFFMKMDIEIGNINETTIGALWQDVDRVARMEATATAEYQAYQAGPPLLLLPDDKWKDWPGGWANWSVETPRLFDKYKEDAKDNILAKQQDLLKKITDAVESLKDLRTLYLTDLYARYSPVPSLRENLGVMPDGSIEETRKKFNKLMADVGAFIEKERADRRKGLAAIGTEFKDLARTLMDTFAAGNAAAIFGPDSTDPFMSQWSSRLAAALLQIDAAERYRDSRLCFPAAGGILGKIHQDLSVLEASVTSYYAVPEAGAVVDKDALKKEIDANYRTCQESFAQLNKELNERKRIETVASTMH